MLFNLSMKDDVCNPLDRGKFLTVDSNGFHGDGDDDGFLVQNRGTDIPAVLVFGSDVFPDPLDSRDEGVCLRVVAAVKNRSREIVAVAFEFRNSAGGRRAPDGRALRCDDAPFLSPLRFGERVDMI